jgi:arsenical pump membrane protein
VLSLIVVGLVVAGFGIGDAVGVAPVWPALAGVLVLAVRQLRQQKTAPAELVRAADLPFAAFVLGLAVVVLAVLDNGVAGALVHVLPLGASLVSLLAAAAIAAVLANLLNNLPATLALLPVASAGGPATVLAVLIGVNIGPNLTYVGSLANLLWRRGLGRHAPDAPAFSLVGLATVPIALVGATAALWLTLQV